MYTLMKRWSLEHVAEGTGVMVLNNPGVEGLGWTVRPLGPVVWGTLPFPFSPFFHTEHHPFPVLVLHD